MKKLFLLTLTALLLITSCNMDATSGIFQSAMNSQTTVTEPITQIIHSDENSIFFVSSKGIYKFDDTGYSCIVSSSEVPHISDGIYVAGTGDDYSIYFTNSKATTDISNIFLHKYTSADGDIQHFDSNFGLTAGDNIIYIADENHIFVNNDNEKKIYQAKLNTTDNQIEYDTNTDVFIDYNVSDIPESKYIGAEMHKNFVTIVYSSTGENSSDAYRYKNYLIDSTYNSTELSLPSTEKLTGAYVKDSTWITTSYVKNENKIIIRKIANGNLEDSASKRVQTEISSTDQEIAIGKLGDNYFFHAAGQRQVNYFDESLSVNTTNFNNFSSKLDFVTIQEDTSSSRVIIPTSVNGVYELTDLTNSNGITRINTYR